VLAGKGSIQHVADLVRLSACLMHPGTASAHHPHLLSNSLGDQAPLPIQFIGSAFVVIPLPNWFVSCALNYLVTLPNLMLISGAVNMLQVWCMVW